MSAKDEPVTFRFSSCSWRFRLAAYMRSLARPQLLIPLAVVALFPVVIDLAVGLMGAQTGLLPLFVVLGLTAALLVVVTGALAAVFRSDAPTAVTFDATGVREELGGRTLTHTWQWITDVTDDGGSLTLHCRQPMRSDQLAPSSRARLLVIDKGAPGVARLIAMLAEHTPHGAGLRDASS